MIIVYEKYQCSVLPLSSERLKFCIQIQKKALANSVCYFYSFLRSDFLGGVGAEADTPSEINHVFADFTPISHCITGSFFSPLRAAEIACRPDFIPRVLLSLSLQ